MDLLSRIKALCKKNNISIAKLEHETGLANGSIRKWEKTAPSADRLGKVADYFKVSTDYLLYGFEKTRVVDIVNTARFGRSIEQFSKDTGVDLQYLNTLCDGNIEEPPSREITDKMMRDPDSQTIYDYAELMKAAGYFDHQTATEYRLEESKKAATNVLMYLPPH